jgi:hypothetical protein
MSITYVDNKLDEVRAELEQARKAYTAATSEINADTKLTEAGKQEELGQYRDRFKNTANELRAKEMKLVEDAITEREKQIDAKSGSTSSDLIAFRDAQDRAERIEGEADAQRVIERALRTNDSSLAHAVFRASMDHGWKTPAETFAQAKPELAEVVKDLRLLTKFRDNSFARSLVYANF